MLVTNSFAEPVANVRPNGKTGRARRLAAVALVAALGICTMEAQAQSVPTADPVERSLQRIDATLSPRINEAARVIAQPQLFGKVESAKPVDKEQDLTSSLPVAAGIDTGNDARARISAPVRTRLTKYSDQFSRILRAEGVPPQLLAVALVESGFDQYALSPKGARGIWQFMPATARRYGLPVNGREDHRIHPGHSTRAAARYLRDLYQQFGDWPLAIAAYNAGEQRVQRIINRTGIRSFDEMSRRGYLPQETRKYVPAVMAVWPHFGGKINNQFHAPDKSSTGQRNTTVEAIVKLGEPAQR